MAITLSTRDPGFEAGFAALLAAKRETDADVDAAVAAIIADVAARGDAALIDYTKRFDRVDADAPTTCASSPTRSPRRRDAAPAETVAALRLAAERIESFHRRQLPRGHRLHRRGRACGSARAGGRSRRPGSTCRAAPRPIPSSVLMNAIPAKVAGVERLVMVVPTPDGVLNPLVLAAARLAGVDEIYRIGGAQAVAALAYGTATIAPVDKIVGPGNAYVAAAKRRVFGRVGIDMIAGPSEILVVADARNDPAWIAADLLSQAEHDAAAQAILITDDADFAAAVERGGRSASSQRCRAPRSRGESWERQRRDHRGRRLGRGGAR